MQRIRPLISLLVLLAPLLALAPGPANLAPTGEDLVLSRSGANAESGQNGQNIDTRTVSHVESTTDFVDDDSQFEAILEQLQREAADSIILDRANFVGCDTPIEEIEKLFERAASPQPTFQERPSAAALMESESDEVDCAICLEPLMEAGSRGQPEAVTCGHMFHADCIGLWKQSKRISTNDGRVPCPMCRSDITPGQESRSYEAALARMRASDTSRLTDRPATTTPRPRRSDGGVINRLSTGDIFDVVSLARRE